MPMEAKEVSAHGKGGTMGHREGFVPTGSADAAPNHSTQLTGAVMEQTGIKPGAETPATTTLQFLVLLSETEAYLQPRR